MKKFLKKLPVMITFVALSVVLLGVYIYMLARPVSYGMAYKHSEKTDENNYIEQTIVVQNNKKAKVTINGKVMGFEMKVTGGAWIAIKGNKALFVGTSEGLDEVVMTEEQYNEAVKLLTDESFKSEDAITSNAFKMTMDGETYTCTGAIVFAAVAGAVELCLLTFACLSVIFFLQDKKKKA